MCKPNKRNGANKKNLIKNVKQVKSVHKKSQNTKPDIIFLLLYTQSFLIQ